MILPQRGYRSKTRLKHEHKAWFVKGRHWHAGIEGRISVLKRAHTLGRCLAHGLNGFQAWVGWGVIAGNLGSWTNLNHWSYSFVKVRKNKISSRCKTLMETWRLTVFLEFRTTNELDFAQQNLEFAIIPAALIVRA